MIINLISRLKRRGIFMQIRPLRDRIIVKRMEEEEKTKGGIIIPDTAKEKPVEGRVIAVGEGRVNKDGKKISPSSMRDRPAAARKSSARRTWISSSGSKSSC